MFLVGKEFDVVEMTRVEFEQEFGAENLKPFVWESRSDAEAWAGQYRGKYVAAANDEWLE